MTKTMTATTAAAIKQELKATFPNVKFSVRKSASGGSINVRWENLPSVNAVNAIVKKYENVSYDQHSGEVLSGGNTFVFATAEYTQEFKKEVENRMTEYTLNNHTHYYRGFTEVVNQMWEEQTSMNEVAEIEKVVIREEKEVTMTNELAKELVNKYVKNETTKKEENTLTQYHLQLQERAMNFKKSLPSNYSELINDELSYEILVNYSESNNAAGEYTETVSGKELKEYIWSNLVLDIVSPLVASEISQNINASVDNSVCESVIVAYNNELNGIELSFSDTLSDEMLSSVCANGFKWSRRKNLFYAKQSEKTIAFANSLSGNDSMRTANDTTSKPSVINSEPVSYPTINIDDLELYIVSDDLQRRLHSSSMFEVDYKKECVNVFQSIQSEAVKIIESTNVESIQYQVKKYLQSFKKRYYEQYIKSLNHKANNPGWAVTGRGGLNVRRYNKMQDRYGNMISNLSEMSKEYDRKLSQFKSVIKKHEQDLNKQAVSDSVSSNTEPVQFITETKDMIYVGRSQRLRTYNAGGYTIAKLWGCFRVFDDKGKEIDANLKTTSKLDDAKNYVIYLIRSQAVNQAV